MNYTELKIRLMQQGAVFTDAARKTMCHSRFGMISFSDYATTGGVVIVIDERVYVNVPVKYQGTPFRIDLLNENLILKYNEEELLTSIHVIPAPKYALDAVCLEDGTPVRELVMTHADRVRISPVYGCSYHCSFCTNNTAYYKEISCEQLDQAFNVALNDPFNVPRHVLISGGTPNEEIDSYIWINHIYRYFPQKYPQLDFDVMLSPRGMKPGQKTSRDYEEFLYFLHDECRVKTLSVNLELYNEKFRERLIPDKCAIGKEAYYQFIRCAVEIFGVNNVRSSLIVGLEPEEDTLKGVQDLIDCRCLPVLSAFIPASGTDMANYPAPSVEYLLKLLNEVNQIVAGSNMQLGPLCRPCTHNSITVEEGEVRL